MLLLVIVEQHGLVIDEESLSGLVELDLSQSVSFVEADQRELSVP